MPPPPDPHAALFEQWRARLTAISRRIVGSDADAQDVVQDCFLTWQAADGAALREPAAWLTTVVQRRSIDCLRRRTREAAATQAAAEQGIGACAGVAPPLPEDPLLASAALGEALAVLLARLSPAERMALVLHEACDCSHADIAAALGTNPANARQYLARGRRRLREHDAVAEAEERRSRELVLRFQAAIHGGDVAALMLLLAAGQPVSVLAAPRAAGCANDAAYLPPRARLMAA